MIRRRNQTPTPAPMLDTVRAALDAAAPRGLRAWLGANETALAAPIVQAVGAVRRILGRSKMVDATGRRWRVWYALVDVDTSQAHGPVFVSNVPFTFARVPAFPPAFQARDLATPAEVAKIRHMAADLDPLRMVAQNLDPTAGAPVLWRDPDSGQMFVLAGNGRTLALLMADAPQYRDYLSELVEMWPAAEGVAPLPGYRVMLARLVERIDGAPLSAREATQLAGASQESLAGIQSRTGAAASTARALGVTMEGMPPFTIREALTEDNVIDFTRQNRDLWTWILDRVDPAKRPGYGNPSRALELLRDVFLAMLPPGVSADALGSADEYEALTAMLPFAVAIETQIAAGNLPRPWSILSALPDALRVAVMLRKTRTPISKLPEMIEAEGVQTTLGGTRTSLNASLLGIMLGAVLSNASGRADPTGVVEQYVLPLVTAGYDAHAAQGGMFGGPSVPNPGRLLARLLRLTLPRTLPPTIRENPRRVARRRNMAARPFLATLDRGGEFLIVKPIPAWASELERAGWVTGTPRQIPGGEAIGLRITRRGRAWLRSQRAAEDAQDRASQVGMF